MASAEDLRKALSVEHFNVDPNDQNAEKEYESWKTKFEIYVASLKANDEQKLHILTNKLNATVYGYIDGLKDYGEAIQKLDSVFKKKPNILFAHYKLSTSNQIPNESKNDVLVKQVEWIEANPNYAVIKDGRGITKTVSTKDLAPAPELIDERIIDQNTGMVDENDDYTNTPQAVLPTDYNKLVEEARSKNPDISIERLSILKDCTPSQIPE